MSAPSSSSTNSSLVAYPQELPISGEQVINILERLPEEILKMVFTWLNWKQLANCRRVCVRLRRNIDRCSLFELERIKQMVQCVEKSSTRSSEEFNNCKSKVIGLIEKPEEAIQLLETLSDDFWLFLSLDSIAERFLPKAQVDAEVLLALFLNKKSRIRNFEYELERFLNKLLPLIDFQNYLKILPKIKDYPDLIQKFVFKIIELPKISFVELEKLVGLLDITNKNRDQIICEIIKRKIDSLGLDQALKLFRAISQEECAYATLLFICKEKVNSARSGKAVIAEMCATNWASTYKDAIRYQVLESTISKIDFDLLFAFQIIDNLECIFISNKSLSLLAQKSAKTKEELTQILEKILNLRFHRAYGLLSALKVTPPHLISEEIFELVKEKLEINEDFIGICAILTRHCKSPEKITDFVKNKLIQLIDSSTDEDEESHDDLLFQLGALELSINREKALDSASRIKDEKLRIQLLLDILLAKYEAGEEIESVINRLMEVKNLENLGERFLEVLETIASKEPERAIELVEKMFKEALHLASIFLSLSKVLKNNQEKSTLCLEKAKRSIEKITDSETKLSLLIRHYKMR